MDYITYTHGTHGGSIPEGQGNGAELLLEKGVAVAVGAPELDGRGRPTDKQWVTADRAEDLIEAGKCSPCDANGNVLTAAPSAQTSTAAVVAAAPAAAVKISIPTGSKTDAASPAAAAASSTAAPSESGAQTPSAAEAAPNAA